MRDLTREGGARNGGGPHPEPEHVDLGPGEEAGLDTAPMPRRVVTEAPRADDGRTAPSRVDEDGMVRQARRLIQEAQAERLGARMVRAVWDAAQMLDPLTRILLARVLAVMALVAASGLSFYTLMLTTGWERVATVALFLLFAAWIVAGQRKAP